MRNGHERASGCGHSQLFPPTALPLVSAVQRKTDWTERKFVLLILLVLFILN
jgi:hypothetical protein